jgi:hypothetical protein
LVAAPAAPHSIELACSSTSGVIVENPHHPIDIYAHAEGYAYLASEWIADDLTSPPIVVLERYH